MHHSPLKSGEQVHVSWCRCNQCAYPLPGSRADRIMKLQAGLLIFAGLAFLALLAANSRGILQSFGFAS